jgi:hypothetical protein
MNFRLKLLLIGSAVFGERKVIAAFYSLYSSSENVLTAACRCLRRHLIFCRQVELMILYLDGELLCSRVSVFFHR